MQQTHKNMQNLWGGTQSCGGHTHISYYVGVTRQSFVPQSPGIGPLNTHLIQVWRVKAVRVAWDALTLPGKT